MFLGESSDHQGNKNRFLANRCPNLSTRRVKWSLIVIENSSKSLDQGRNLPLNGDYQKKHTDTTDPP